MRRRHFARLIGAAIVVAARPAAAAGGLSVRASIGSARVPVGEPVQLRVEVEREGRGQAPEPILPDVLGNAFEVQGPSVGISSRAEFGTFQASSRSVRTHTYILIPLKAGRYDLQFSARAGGEQARSDTLVLEVIGAGDAGQQTPQRNRPTEAQGDIFLWAVTDKTTAYVGEQITYELDVYERSRFLNVHLRTLPSFQDFWTEELPEGQQRREVVGGTPYRVHPGLRRALFPQHAGTLNVGSAQVAVGLRRRLDSKPVAIEVKPLPAEGQPRGFSANNVGRYTVSAAVDRTRVAPGEPFTLTVTVEGSGNLSFLDMGSWPEVDGVRRYDPKVETQLRRGRVIGGSRHYEFLVIPQRPGTVTIPPHELHFFDPARERYETAKSDPIEIEVEGAAVAVDPDEGAAATVETASAGEQLAPILAPEGLPRKIPRQRWLTPRRWLYAAVAAPTTVGIAAGAGLVWRRYGPDEQARQRGEQRRRRRELIESARESLDGGDGFHASVAALLQELSLRRAGPDGVGLPRPELLRLLEARGVPTKDVERLRALLDRCDAARFGAQSGSRAERDSLLKDALEMIKRPGFAKGAP